MNASGPARTPVALVGVTCALAALVLYAATCSPGVVFQDGGVHQYRIVSGQLVSPYGLALSHPLHYWLGRAALVLLPWGDAAYRLNLLSAICGAVGVGVLAAVVTALTGRGLPGVLAASAAGVAQTYWQHSVATETYTLAAALMTIEWCVLLHYARTRQPGLLVVLCAVNGLHVADHLLGLLTLVTYAGLAVERVLRGRLAFRWLPFAAAVWLVTASPYWLLVIAEWRSSGELGATLYSAFFGLGPVGRGYAREVFNVSLSPGLLARAGLVYGYCFPSLVPLIALVGLFRPARRRGRVFRHVLIAQTLILGVFVIRYAIRDQYTFFVPLCVLTGLWFGLGADACLRCVRRPSPRAWLVTGLVAQVILPLIVYAAFPVMAEQRGWFRDRLRDIPYRDEYRHFFQPWKNGDDAADMLALDALNRAGAGGWVLADGTTAYAIACRYTVSGGPADVRIFDGWRCVNDARWSHVTPEQLRERLATGGKVVAVPGFRVEELWSRDFQLVKGAVLWRVELPPAAR